MSVTSQQLAKTLVHMAAEHDGDVKGVVEKFTTFLKKNHLTGMLPNVLRHLSIMKERQDAQRAIEVASPYPLSQATLDTIMQQLSSQGLGSVTTRVDKELIGGVIVKHDGVRYDGSVRGQLEKLRTALLG
jgi:F-type H+-transporting ATPase subunit delta